MMETSYDTFLAAKAHTVQPVGRADAFDVHPMLYPFQADIVRWAVKLGRAAIFADCGLGKTLMQLEWARAFAGRVLIVTPIAVGTQTIAEAKRIGLAVTRVLAPEECGDGPGIWTTNYERIEKFAGIPLDAIVLDESSILKSIDGKTRGMLLKEFTRIPYRLCCTATPAPNDVAELANHAEFLGVMGRAEMLATWFVHDEKGSTGSGAGGWRLKGWSADAMYSWMAKWAAFIRAPSDLGYSDDGFVLPQLTVRDEMVYTDWKPDGMLFAAGLGGVGDRCRVRKSTICDRIGRAVEVVYNSWKINPLTSSDTTLPIEKSGSRKPRYTEGITPTNGTPTIASGTPIIASRSEPCNSQRDGQIQIRCDNNTTNPISEIAKSASRPSEHTTSSIQTISATPTSEPITELTGRSLPDCSNSREASAQSAALQQRSEGGPVCTSTTITPPAESGESCARPATWASGSSTTIQPRYDPQPCTSKEQWLIWCGLNEEQDRLEKAFGDDCVSIRGTTPEENRIEYERRWREGEVPILIAKPVQFGHGMNWQHCHKMIFLGLGDSYESYYQSIRRCWRFGQHEPVDVRIVISEAEGEIAGNVRRKEHDATKMASAVVAAMHDSQLESVRGVRQMDEYTTDDDILEGYWKLMLGDCVERIKEVPDSSIGLSVFSPPFASLYTYSASDRDMGNNKNYDEFFKHFGYLIPELIRVTKPGRRCCVHVQQVTTTKATHGIIGWRDFRADTVKAFVTAGWVYDGEVVIDKDPQAQAIRTKSKQLMFCTKARDASWLRPAMADYILLFRHPEDNIEPVLPGDDVSNEDWILWARPIWYGIRESDTLQVARARDDKDEKHVCPLQLGTIERCVRLWSNVGDTVLSPFAGIGSEGFVSLQHGRKFVGIELKPSYWRVARKNLRMAMAQGDLFADDGADLDDGPEDEE